MTQAIVTYLNAVIDTVGRVDERYCMAELRSDGTTTVPYTYVGNGKVKPISIDGGSLSYWRISGAVPPMEQIASQYGKPRLSATYPLRLVIVARRADSTVDDGFMPTRLAEDIANALTGSHPDLKTLLKANTVSVSAGYDVNITSVWADEFKGTGVNDPNYTRTIMALSVSVNVVGDRACWENECDYDTDILHLFDFCQSGTVARLTDAQVACLQAELCDPCEDATITVNTAPFGTAPSGGALNVPVVNGGANQVGSIVAGEVVIGNNSTFINGTQVTDQEAEVDANIFVTLDGTQSGTWNAGTQTWEVTGAACADANLEINGVQQETIASGATFNLIATLDGVAGGSYNAGTNTLSFTSNTGWQPNPDWLPLPELTSANERVCMLVIVFENRLNRVTVKYPNLTASTDWGDGTAATVSNGAKQEHLYDYVSIAGTVYQWPNSGENYKQCILSTTRVGGAIANADFSDSYATAPINQGAFIVDAIISLPNATILYMTNLFGRQLHILERLRIVGLGAIAAGGGWIRLGHSRNLQSIELPPNKAGNWAGAFTITGRCAVPDINWDAVSTCLQMFQASDIISHGYLIANSSNSLAYYADLCENLGSFGYIDAPLATNALQMFNGCGVLQTVGDIDAPLLQICTNMFSNCFALGSVRFLDASAITTTTNMFANCLSLYDLEMFGLTRGVSLTNSSMGNYGMGNFAASLGTASGAQTITVTGTPFGALLTALDATALAIRLVMTGKGYTVVN